MTKEKLLLKITEKWHIKIISVAAALLISIFHRMNTLETRFLTVPLVIKTNEQLVPVNSFAKTVRISVRGEAASINLILEEDIEAYIDLTRYTNEGLFRIPVQILKSGNALGVEPLEISVYPTQIQSILEQKESRDIPVFPVFKGTIARGFEIIDQSINPASVTAEGPRGIINNQREFTTNAVEIGGRSESFSLLINIVNDNPLITIRGNKMLEYSAVIRPIQHELGFNEDDEEGLAISENRDGLE